MKKIYLLVLLLFSIYPSFGQIGYKKADIDTEELFKLIRQKQAELRQRVVFNTIIKESKRTGSFVVKQYIYHTFNILANEINKSVINRDVIKKTEELVIVFAISEIIHPLISAETATLKNKTKKNQEPLPVGFKEVVKEIIKSNTINGEELGNNEEEFIPIDFTQLDNFNFTLDLVYTALQDNEYFKKFGLFDGYLNNQENFIWYNNDNMFLSNTAIDEVTKKTLLSTCISKIKGLTNSNNFSTEVATLQSTFKEILKLIAETNEDNFVAKSFEAIRKVAIIYQKYEIDKRNVVFTIFDFMGKYFIQEGDQVFVDAESIIVALEERFVDNKNRTIIPIFNIGINTIMFNDNYYFTTNGEVIKVNAMGFASEKIGIKVRLDNAKYRRSLPTDVSFRFRGKYRNWSRPQEEPLISNVHLLVYGSGFLYNLADLSSEKKFDKYLFGWGWGLSFFNGLDANISFGTPIDWSSWENTFNIDNFYLGIGFDVRIGEYLTQVKNKTKD